MAELFMDCVETFAVDGSSKEYKFFNVSKLDPECYSRLPFSIRVLLEAAVRKCDGFQITRNDVANIMNWSRLRSSVDVPFQPARVILQDFTGVPAVVDFAAMREAVHALGGDPKLINPRCPSDLVIDHSVQVDFSRSDDARAKNETLEFERNRERFTFLKWGANAFSNMLIVPPGSGIVHQVNLEYLARVCFVAEDDGLVYPDSVVGTDSHTTMINGLGVLGWGVGGIEAEAVMLGQPISMVLPHVVGYKITGRLGSFITSTDVVLTITKHLRHVGVVGKFVEFFGDGVSNLSIADRATIANMCPEYGATCAFFPVDDQSIDYLRQTNRDVDKLKVIDAYLKVSGMKRNFSDETQDPEFSQVIELDLTTVVASCSGPKRPHDRVSVTNMKRDFTECLVSPAGFKGFGVSLPDTSVPFVFEGSEFSLKHGSVLIAAITSCTNTSNPSVMLGAGLLAKNAVEAGLTVAPYIKTSLSPGSGVVTHYLQESGVIPYLTALGFNIVGYGCMTCIGNSGPLDENVTAAVKKNDLVCCGVLSGNRNFEGRIHPDTRANYLASPPLVIAYAIAGRVDIDFETEPLGFCPKPVFLRDIWPQRERLQEVEKQFVIPRLFDEVYSNVTAGNQQWNKLEVLGSELYPWDKQSTYVKRPPFFEDMTVDVPEVDRSIKDANVLLNLGDSVTTDHISPAGSIARSSCAAKYLSSKQVTPREFNSYGSRRGNDEVMSRGTFANIRLINKFLGGKAGPNTIHLPTGDQTSIYEAAQLYRQSGTPLIVLAGKDYGCGSSRDWAAKGPFLLGIKAVIAESYERIHRSNLVGMGIVPLQYMNGQTAETLGLSGKEKFNIILPPASDFRPGQEVSVTTDTNKEFKVVARMDTKLELAYFHNGGILQYMIRKVMKT